MQSGEGSGKMRETPDIDPESSKNSGFAIPVFTSVSVPTDHACYFAEQTLSHRPFPHRAWPLRHQTDQEGRQNRPVFWSAAGFQKEEGRRDREQISVRAQWALDHRRLGRREHCAVYQSRLQAECGIRRQRAQAQGRDPRDQEHRARRRDQLRLRHRLLQGISEADRLQMRRLREETQEEARRGEGRKTAPESQGGEESSEESQKTGGEGRGKAGAKAERQVERRKGERQTPERARRKIYGEQNDCREIRNFRQA